MEFSLAEIFDAQEAIANSASDRLRLFAVQKNASNVPLDDLVVRAYAPPLEKELAQLAHTDTSTSAPACKPEGVSFLVS
jgi:hypothetical protein